MRAVIVATVFSLLCVTQPTSALCPATNCDAGATKYLVRTSCQDASGNEIRDCFQSMEMLTASWLWASRQPSASDPVVIDVGAGSFGPFICENGGHVIVRGAGREATLLVGSVSSDNAGISIDGCDELVFSNLSAEGNWFGVLWEGGGQSGWSKVDLVSRATTGFPPFSAWRDGGGDSLHTFFDCTFSVTGPGAADLGPWAFFSNSSRHFFYDVTVSVPPMAQASVSFPKTGIFLGSGARLEAFNSRVRVVSELQNESYPVRGLWLLDGAYAHLEDVSIVTESPGPGGTEPIAAAPGASVEKINVSFK